MGIFSSIFSSGPDTERIDVDGLNAMIEKKDKFTLVDVRTQKETREGVIPGAMLVPLNVIESSGAPKLAGKVIVYCASGMRSVAARKALKRQGVEDVVDLKGGINAWILSGGKTTKG